MFRNYRCVTLVGTLALTACTVIPESPQYSQGPAQVTYAQPLNASYQTTQAAAAAQSDCRRQETNRELIGGAVGGTVGAIAGKKLIGGTKGLVAGAALGGIAGYGIGDISKDCSPAPVQSYAPSAQSSTVYQNAQTYGATPTGFSQISCPVGTKPASNGTCLLDDPNTNLQSATFTGVQTPNIQRVQSQPQTLTQVQPANVISAATTPIYAPTAPSAYRATNIAQPSGVNTYTGNYRVVSGDTVYSLARKLCVPVSAIQSTNGLDANYGIQIGQNLNLPNSQC